jgi:acyl-CoA synthetase (NDP forming)
MEIKATRGEFARDFDRLFNPTSIAVVGASNYYGKWGFFLPMNIIGGGYRGKLFMVNPKEREVLGYKAYPSLRDIEEKVDLVIVAIPAKKVAGIIEDAAAKGIKNAIVVSSNFSEVGAEGIKLERELAELANRHEITIVGPNTMGIYSATSSLCALGAPVVPLKGSVGFVSQSGNLGIQLITWGQRRGIGFSRFIGSGNEANTETSDFLEYLGEDPHTSTIILYIEGIDDGRRFLEVARRITPHKPIIALKVGKSEHGSQAVRSHSGALAGSIDLFRGLMEQTGIIEAETTEELVDLAAAFSSLPLPRGRKVALMTLGGGWGVVAADACEREGLQFAHLSPELIDELDQLLPRFWSRRNPVDIVGNVRRSNHYRVIDALINYPEVDILIAMGALLGKRFFNDFLINSTLRPFCNLLRLHPREVMPFLRSIPRGFYKSFVRRKERNPEGSGGINPAEAKLWSDTALIRHLLQLMREKGKPIIAVAVDDREEEASQRFRRAGLFTAPTPERAVRVAGKLARYSQFRSEKLRSGS